MRFRPAAAEPAVLALTSGFRQESPKIARDILRVADQSWAAWEVKSVDGPEAAMVERQAKKPSMAVLGNAEHARYTKGKKKCATKDISNLGSWVTRITDCEGE